MTFYSGLRARFAAIPGVRSAGFSDKGLIGEGIGMTSVSVSGSVPQDSSEILSVGAGFFTTMQSPILLGRAIDDRDRAGAPMAAVVNEVFAKRNFGDRNPIGHHIALGRMCAKCNIEIVGVSGNALYGNLKGTPEPTVFLAFAQGIWPLNKAVFELRAAGDPLRHVPAVREIVRQADSRLPVFDIRTQRAAIDASINQEIAFARLCSAFALLALAIACVGLYGTMSYDVARRTGEIGIRMALGARRAGRVEAGEVVPLRDETERSAGVGRIGSDPGECSDSGWLPAGSKCVSNRSDDRSAARIRLAAFSSTSRHFPVP
jgi:macrolide transport system ATP-binding/permease protein